MELPKLEKFNAFETENADIWVQRYELMCEFSKWDEVQATRAFTCFIDNYALAWYMLLDAEDQNSKDKLFRKFKERFGRKSIEKVGLWKDAADLNQKQNETVSQFISRIERLCFLAGQTVMMEQFILRGLRPEFVVPFVTGTGLKQNFSVSEAIDAALLADIIMQIVLKPEPVEITSAIKDNPTSQNQPRSDGCSRADCKINVRIGSSVIHTLVDTGAAVSVINTKTYQSLQVDKLYPVDKSDLLGVRGVNDNFIRVLGKVTLPVEIGKLTLFHDFYILDDVNMSLILGRDFMHDQKAEISFPKQVLSLQNGMTEVSLSDANPVRQFPYRTTPKTKEEINTHLDEMEEQGIIRKSMSPWSSPILLVAKPNGEKRVCVDYRKLNRLTKIYTQSLPNLSDVLDTLGEKQAQTYSVWDMRQGFWQLELDEQSKEKTAFMTHRGQYEFNRLPYGLANSPATFNMIMNEVIRDLNWKSALVYVDDILIYSKNFEEHLCHLAALFDKLIEANLKLKPSKCQFACKEVQYLGHIITKEGIAVDPEKRHLYIPLQHRKC
ncbi:Retrovirus-related Pol polyprotein from transposon 297,Retrovirus-related Pol polyprotein from transposon 17.6 [Mytilus coruscus]|uniref:Retrovirus-related Pol polyprotein from transposon 297,Retrovirus-related Pol polyprotein from transposon 17.6 n=1 Tax=Mytilus coruscus TaxID=42192 RepID=A0A6J8AHG7_MYTCO|nr:Retrovirus-related Pol polyprotein from transposon 297,Retrovirus-related Pol polyprotein from transposon 17.6 [Mytilus coruscus]